ncbi:thymidine kinase [Rhodoferax aquaticus]|uniref:Thymidine kinase n=1 Tax=Rhodoferax aquaticus TaxID=2527691 RepID=A0A515EN42_9BURK|nr:thymidine kinase [Rhodoferax aquaticus]QDL54081.1 thymidine kinase [Rhodoferax aquaticus]
MAKLYFRFSAMNAGKSTSLLQIAYNYEEQGQKVMLFTASIDDRSGTGCIASRLGLNRQAGVFDAQTDFYTLLAKHRELACVLIDESQFLSIAQVRQLHQVAHLLNIPVICFGLRSDFQGNPFPGAAHLLTLADDLEEIKTICACGRKATMNIRLDAQGIRVREGQQVEIGGNERYQQVCARCFYKDSEVALPASN